MKATLVGLGGGMTRNAMQGLFILAGIALVITELNNSRSLAIVGLGLIVLAVVGRFMGSKDE